MAVPEAMDVQILDALLAALAGIGTPAGSWLTTPYAAMDGVPNDEMGRLDKPRLFVQHVSTAPSDGSFGTGKHRWSATFNVWVAAADMRTADRARTDVLRALYAAEGTVTTSFGQHFWPGTWAFHDELVKAGIWLGTQPVTLDYETDHTNP